MKYLLLWLEGPLQSWGYESRFDVRATHSFPTLSGICGLLLASSGDSGPQRELLARLRNADFAAIEFEEVDSNSEKATPSPAPQLRDYHMVGNGYDERDPWQSLHIPRKRDGGKAVGGGAKQTYRFYLQDKKFAVLLGLDDDLAAKFAASLQAPAFDLYLGRKCCVPTEFIFRGCFDSREEAKAAMMALVQTLAKRREEEQEEKELEPGPKKELRPGRCFVPAEPDELTDDAFFIADVPVQFGERKLYTERCMKIVPYVEADG